MAKLRVKTGDKVKVITGKDKGKVGEILKVLPNDNRVIVSGVNVAKKHVKATQTTEGGIQSKELSIHVSNVSHVDPKSGSAVKVGYKKLDDGSKVRFSRKSGEIITKEGK